jgi:hypothetical protein
MALEVNIKLLAKVIKFDAPIGSISLLADGNPTHLQLICENAEQKSTT